MPNKMVKCPEVLVFAGPNGSGKSTVTSLIPVVGMYINADEIKKALLCTDLEAALEADRLRESALEEKRNFTFETVLSTERKIEFLRKTKEKGYFIRCVFVLTTDENINVQRVQVRAMAGGHDVPVEKIKSRYKKSLSNIPELLEVCDILHIYDNTHVPFRIFKKRKNEMFYWENEFWNKEKIELLVGHTL